ncbi:HAD-IB family phosphatase, partial [Burkholderia cenocepacia]
MTDRIVAAFDFDGTITTTDSFRHFVRQAVGTPRFAWAGLRALPWIVAMKAGLLSRGDAKAKFASFAFGPIREDVLDAQARRFVDSYLPNLVRPEMLERVREHRARGHEVVLVSASPSLYLEKWAKT